MSQRALQIFPSAARTTHASSSEINAQSATNVTFGLNVSAFSGTSITFTIEGYDHVAGAWYTLLASAAISATGRTAYHIGPNMPTTANVSATRVLPLRVRVTPSGTITSVTYSMVAYLQR